MINIDNDDDMVQFLQDVLNDEYVLLVGSEVILKQTDSTNGDVNKLIFNEVKNSCTDARSFSDEINVTPGKTNQSVLKVNKNIDANNYCEELCSFLKTKLFKIVLTTTIDDYLEHIMKEVWGENLRTVDLVNHNPRSSQSNPLKEWEKELTDYVNFEKNNLTPTLVYVFGKASNDVKQLNSVYNDNEAILLIERLIRDYTRNEASEPFNKRFKKALQVKWMDFIRDRNVLSVGCKFDDWYFRFFWHLLTGKLNAEGYKSGVFFSYNNNNVHKESEDYKKLEALEKKFNVKHENRKLEFFLDNLKVNCKVDARQFMQNFATKIENDCKEIIIKKLRSESGVFLSYCRDDKDFAYKLFIRLRNWGYGVWIDFEQLLGSQNWPEDINKGIESSSVFIMLLSNNIREHSSNDMSKNPPERDFHYYRDVEWRWANDHHKTIVPVAIEDYSFDKDYHKFCEKIIGNRPDGIVLEKVYEPIGTGWEKLCALLDDKIQKQK